MRLIYLALTFFGLACNQQSLAGQNKIAPDAFEEMLQQDSSIQLLDVRTPEEFQTGHLANAINLNFQSPDFAKNISSLDKTRPTLVYCAVGGRSAQAATQLRKLGFTKVYDLKGGIIAWKAAGKAVK